MSIKSISPQPLLYPTKRELIIRMIELSILHFELGDLLCTQTPRYQLDLVSECAILFLIGFQEDELNGELLGFYRGLMEQTLSLEINSKDRLQTKLQAERVYDSLLTRKEMEGGIYNQEQAVIRKCRFDKV
jgi:hypothetical protein